MSSWFFFPPICFTALSFTWKVLILLKISFVYCEAKIKVGFVPPQIGGCFSPIC